MAGFYVPDQLYLESVLLHHEEDIDEVCLCRDTTGGSCGILGLLSNEKLDVLESERVVGGICAALAVLNGTEEE